MTNKGPQEHLKHPRPGKDETPKVPAGKVISKGDVSDQDPKRRIGQYGGTGEPHSTQNK
jgi:hypothetical protein